MIAVVDYRAGNLTSVLAALNSLGHEGKITSDPAEIAAAERVIFPGVGAAGQAMENLRELGLVEVIRGVVESGKPFLGICLGYQILFEYSEEDGGHDCLGLLRGKVVHFADGLSEGASNRPLKIPQMGWNGVQFRGEHPLWSKLPKGSEFYFVHSYHPVPDSGDICATTTYGYEFASGVLRDNLVAFQFHPEKSGRPGLKLLDNFCRWQPTLDA
jgi:glutamine amidotransferase